MKPIIFVSPLTISLKTLRESLGLIAKEENIEIFDIDNIDEATQTIASIGPSIILVSNQDKCNQILKKNRKHLSNFKSKILLVTQGSLSPAELEKMTKYGLSDNLFEPINPKNLLYKIKMAAKSLPEQKNNEMNENEIKTFSMSKDETSVNTTEKLHMEKGIITDENSLSDSKHIDDENKLAILDDYRQKKNQVSLNVEQDDSPIAETSQESSSQEKKSRLGSLLKSFGSFSKKKTTKDSIELEIDKKKEGPTTLDLEVEPEIKPENNAPKEPESPSVPLAATTELNLEQAPTKTKKNIKLDLEEEQKKSSMEITLEDINLMRKRGIRLDISPNTPKDHLESILKRDPVLRKKIINFKMTEEAKKNKKAGLKIEPEEGKGKKQPKFDIMKVRRAGSFESSEAVKEKILEEKRILLQQKMQAENELRAKEAQEEIQKKEEVVIVYEPNSKSLEKIIEMLTIYQDKKMDRLEIFRRCAQIIYEFKNGLTCFLSYNADKKEYDDLFVSHTQEFNTDKENCGEEQWKQYRSERIKKWGETKTATWSDEWFTGLSKDAEFISPVIEGKNILGVVVVHFIFKDNQNISESDARRIEVFVESTRGVYLERFKGNKDKSGEVEEELNGDGTSYAKIFKDFFDKIFKKAA